MERRNFLKGTLGSILSGAVILSNPKVLQGEVIDKVIKPSNSLLLPKQKEIILSTTQELNQLGFSGWMWAERWSINMRSDMIETSSMFGSEPPYVRGLSSIEVDIHGVMDEVTFTKFNGRMAGLNSRIYLSM